jgi:hypothetical protein
MDCVLPSPIAARRAYFHYISPDSLLQLMAVIYTSNEMSNFSPKETVTSDAEARNLAASTEGQGPVRGRSVFMVETVAAGVSVRTAFLTEDGRLADLPALFPDLSYATSQIDELKQLVVAHFAQAAQVGAQVIAAQAAAATAGAAPAEATPAEPTPATASADRSQTLSDSAA